MPGFLGELVTSYGKKKEGVGAGKRGKEDKKNPKNRATCTSLSGWERVSYATFSFLVLGGFLSGYVHSSSLSSDTSWSLSSGVLFLNIHRNICWDVLEYTRMYWYILGYTGYTEVY